MLVAVGYFWLVFRKTYRTASNQTDIAAQCPSAKEAITNLRLFIVFIVIFLLVIVLLITHAQTGISVALVGVIAAGLTLACAYKHTQVIIRRIDWQTLVFFFGLFICVSGLEQTGALQTLAVWIRRVSGGSLVAVITIILWVSAFASAVVDNIPFAATMIPVIKSLAAYGLPLPPLAWTLALGTDIGGNGTPIGASANVVGIAIAEKEGYKISWGRYLRYALPAMILVVGICWVMLILRYA
jgi:Na+/H+ antiporter NhaD/arsenite permease-like protein